MRQTKIVIITGLDEEGLKEKALSSGADEFMNKPINIETLNKTLNKFFSV